MLTIRSESEGDRLEVDAIVSLAFADGEDQPMEVELVRRLRFSQVWIPELALVAIDEGEPIGYSLTTRARAAGVPVLALGPIAVHPDH